MENNTDVDFRRFLRFTPTAMEADEALRAGPGALIGVSSAAAAALATINIHSIFDLAASRVFAAAAALVAIEQDPTAVEARLNVVASDVAQMPPGVPVRELANQPISILRAIGETAAPSLAEALDVATVRDLAFWPPYHAAKAILSAGFFPEESQGFDADAPADLLPKSGVYPTERVFFKKLVIDAVPESADGARPIEQAQPIDLAAALAAPAGFGRLTTGALLTFSQSWFAQGLTLGQLLHSTSLAPGESTRIAVLDWSRRSRAAASEDISESELLSNTMRHSRSLSEVTRATAREFQSGQSSTKAESTAAQAGGGFGLEIGPLAIGGSGGVSMNTTEVMSASSSFGARDLAANYAQDINDRSQQNASSVRNRRASIVREVSQAEHEQISTRVVTNYNHMHALSIHYYEVVQAFRTTTQLERAERCLFVPMKLVSFRDVAIVDRWRLVLAGAALSERARRQLTVEYGVVEIIPQTPRITPGRVIVGGQFDVRGSTLGSNAIATFSSAAMAAGNSISTAAATTGTNAPTIDPPATSNPPTPAPITANTDYQRAPINAPAALLALKGWDIEQLNRVGWATGRLLMQAGSDSVFISDDALVVGFALRNAQAARFVVRLHNGQEVTPAATTATAFSFNAPIAITELESIAVQFASQQELRTALVLQLNLLGTVMPLDVPIVLKPMSVPWEVVKFGSVTAARELVEHLEANRLHYTQAILRALDAATVAALLAPYTYRGLPLGQLVDPQPIAVMANFLVFKLNVATGGEADDPRWAEEQTAWQTWLERRGLDRPAPKGEIIPLPSGGVFAEAILGRYNAAEKTDLTRFWNWQDSPIPITAPEIAPVQAGSRAQPEEIRPGQLSAPVLSIQAPTALPDPTGIAAIINAIQNGNMFRDMSGLAQTLALAQTALQASAAGATAVGEQAGQNLKTVMENNTERMRIAAAVATGGASGLAGGSGATGSRQAKNVTEEGARLNYARGLDANSASGGSAIGGIDGAGGASGGVIDASSPQFGRSAEVRQPSIERSLFDRQTGGVAANLANEIADMVDAENPAASGGGAGGATASVVDPFPRPIIMSLDMVNVTFRNCIEAASQPADVNDLCGAVVDLTGNPDLPPYAGHNDTDNLYVGSLAKIYPLLAAFELRRRVTQQAKDMIKLGLSTAAPGWQDEVIAELKKGWQPQLDAAFPGLPSGFPDLARIVRFSPDGNAELLDEFLDWIRVALGENDKAAAGKYIRALSYPYINGVLRAAGFFKPADKTGLWISGDYNGNDWLPADGAGQPLTPRWRLPGHPVSNFTGTAQQVVRFLGLMAQGKLIDSAASSTMISLLGAPFLQDTLRDATPSARPFTSADGKVGIGEWDSRYHDSAIVRIERGGDPARTISYAMAVLGSPNGVTALQKLELAYHDCVVTRHP